MFFEGTFSIDASGDGSRLDRALEAVMPGSGLRLRRRLCDEGHVSVDGRARKPGYKVRAGQTVEIGEVRAMTTADELGLRIVRLEGGFAAVNKPGGVHSAAISGKDEPSAEGVLAELFPGCEPVLLNRLDYLTSGLLLVALTPEAREAYLRCEADGAIKKFYLARVQGRLDGIVSVRSRLDTDDRKTTRVLAEPDPDSRRWTGITALSHDNAAGTSLVRCLIMKGARHQIRAHLSSIGHPILGDPLYGGGESPRGLMLQHQRIEMPGFQAEAIPLF
ncbi:Ribosomal large subunit pseudouridine synthase C [Pseudodesulfovibrio hydrargyri]|uniref:Ribosomal large subunit pseudouridine synthase C n=1 Tax=Pseudodesulfovibrio hydrargyri TaxID=2125990 RepID=A0A1J5N7B4_9BACT|nr:RluA family pseudouridine synthase [Pseudodesulfovibrio hydrargyri]OIQ51523.1 Ribosomal large subunit pseudouridine synthase C [Pseudodesulfovibrio hydrargyri]